MVDPVDALFSGDPEVGRTDAVLVQRGGHVVFERYGDGVDAGSTLRSWSMAKSMLHACVGMLVDEGRLVLDEPAPVPEWSDPADPRHAITLRHLLEMRPGLAWSEVYLPDAGSDVVEMLFGIDLGPHPDVAAFAAAKPLAAAPGTAFNYSSGTSNIVSRIVRDAVGAGADYERWLRERLFDPLGMRSAEPKFDAAGTWIASSYCFCTAREFASFGRLYLDRGMRDGVRLLPADWVATVDREISRDADGKGHSMHWWRWGAPGIDAFYAAGFEGQRTVVVPALDLVVVRLGQTPDTIDTVDAHLTSLIESYA